MTKKETIEIMIAVKSIWPKMSVSDPVVEIWCDMWADVNKLAASAAVRAFAEMPEQTDPPHIGALLHFAREWQYRNNLTTKRLNEPEPSPEEVAEAKRILREMIDKLK